MDGGFTVRDTHCTWEAQQGAPEATLPCLFVISVAWPLILLLFDIDTPREPRSPPVPCAGRTV